MSFVYDLMEWVHPGTIHEYAAADQKQLEPSKAASTTTVANAGGLSSSPLKAGPRQVVNGDEG